MKLLRWAIGGASAYVIYKYSIGRKAKGEDVFVTPEKAVKKIAGENPPGRKRSASKATSANKGKAAKPAVADTAVPEKPKRKRAPRKTGSEPAAKT